MMIMNFLRGVFFYEPKISSTDAWPHCEVMVGMIPTTSHGIQIQSQVDWGCNLYDGDIFKLCIGR